MSNWYVVRVGKKEKQPRQMFDRFGLWLKCINQ